MHLGDSSSLAEESQQAEHGQKEAVHAMGKKGLYLTHCHTYKAGDKGLGKGKGERQQNDMTNAISRECGDVIFDIILMMKIALLVFLICLVVGQPQQTANPLVQEVTTEQKKPTPAQAPNSTPQVGSTPSQSAPASNNPPVSPQITIATNIPVTPEQVTPLPATPTTTQKPSLPNPSLPQVKVPEKTPTPNPKDTPLPVQTERKIETPPKEQTTSAASAKAETATPQTTLPPTTPKVQEGPIPGPTPEINTNSAPLQQQASLPPQTPQSSQLQTASIPSQTTATSALSTPAVLPPRQSAEGPLIDTVESSTAAKGTVPTTGVPASTEPDLLERAKKPSLTTTTPTSQSIEGQRVPPTAVQSAIVSSQEKVAPSHPSSPSTPSNTPTKTQPLKKPLTLDTLLPSPASSSIILNSLLGILLLFALLQLLGLLCRKKKRYTEKFQEYSQRTQADQLQGMD